VPNKRRLNCKRQGKYNRRKMKRERKRRWKR
jgi:hypothetical protein